MIDTQINLTIQASIALFVNLSMEDFWGLGS